MQGAAARIAAPTPGNKKTGIASVFFELWRNRALYAMFLPAIILLLLFNYLPLFGLTLVFKDFDFGLGIFKSPVQTPWYGNFTFLFRNEGTLRAVGNTLINNLSFMIGNTTSAILLAVLLNEVLIAPIKRISQSMTLLPYFISTVVISVFIYQIFNTDNGMVNGLLKSFGLAPVSWYESPQYWRAILTAIFVWKNAGYLSVIYLATIAGIDASLYEAAQIDGAKRFGRIWHITLPLIRPTIITMTLLSIGNIMRSDFTLYYAIVGDNALLFKTADVLDTFIFRNLRKLGDFTMSGAASFVQSILSGVLLTVFNGIARRIDANASLF